LQARKLSERGVTMPLTKEQLTTIKQELDKADRAVKDANADIALARRAGIDVADMEAELKTVRDQIRRMRAVYR